MMNRMGALLSARWFRLVGAAASAVCGTALVLGLLDWMNKAPPQKTVHKARKVIAMRVERRKKPRVRERIQQRRPPRKASRRPRAPLPSLGGALSGIDLGIPSFGENSLARAQDSLLGASAALKDVLMTARAVDSPPKAAARVAPRYPRRARAQGITGHVKLKLLIGADGRVLQVQVVDSKPRGVFDAEATAAIRQWRFSPARYRGQAVKLWVTQTLRFDLG